MSEYQPKIIHYDSEGDPHWQFVERDVPTVTGQVFAANVEMLTDFDGNIVGFTIYEPKAEAGEAVAFISPSSLRALHHEPCVDGVRVKPLEWRESASSIAPSYVVSTAHCLAGMYQAWEYADGAAWTGPQYGVRNRVLGRLPEAKAAAQLDYETRIRAALNPGGRDAR